jgi:hypothetical protein
MISSSRLQLPDPITQPDTVLVILLLLIALQFFFEAFNGVGIDPQFQTCPIKKVTQCWSGIRLQGMGVDLLQMEPVNTVIQIDVPVRAWCADVFEQFAAFGTIPCMILQVDTHELYEYVRPVLRFIDRHQLYADAGGIE